MRLGLGSYSFRWALGTPTFDPGRRATLSDLLEEAGKLGVEVLQVADMPELASANADDLAWLKKDGAEAGVRWQVGFTGATTENLRRYLDIAVELGSDLVRVVIHDAGSGSAEVAAICEYAARYEDAGITLGIENHFTSTSPRLVEAIETIDSPAVGVVLDVANSIMCGEWPDETIRTLAPFAVCIHLKDYLLEVDPQGVGGRVVGAPLGTGLTDPHTVFTPFRGAESSIAVIVEQWAPRLDTVTGTLALEREWREASVNAARRWLMEENAR